MIYERNTNAKRVVRLASHTAATAFESQFASEDINPPEARLAANPLGLTWDCYHHACIRLVEVDASSIEIAPLRKCASNDPACENSAYGTIDC